MNTKNKIIGPVWYKHPVKLLALTLLGLLGAALQGALFTDEFKATLYRPVKLANEDGSFWEVVFSAWPLLIFIFLLIPGLVAGVFSLLSFSSDYSEYLSEQSKNSELSKELEDYRYRLTAKREELYSVTKQLDALFETQLRSFVKSLGFGGQDHNDDRVSVYLPSTKDNCFYLAVRYSLNQEWTKNSENEYHVSKGVVGKAWKDGVHFTDNLPEWTDRIRDQNKYKRICRDQYGYIDEEVEKMRMRSRLYFGWAVNDLSDTKPAGVVVIESMQVDRWPEAALTELFEEQKIDLRGFVERLATQNARKDYLSSPKQQNADNQPNTNPV